MTSEPDPQPLAIIPVGEVSTCLLQLKHSQCLRVVELTPCLRSLILTCRMIPAMSQAAIKEQS